MVLLGFVVLVAAVAASSATVERKVSRMERRLAGLERKLDAVIGHLGVVIAEPGLPEVRALLAQGKKIEAIKVYREHTGADLKEAKEAVERLAGR
jgi:ribosomal protein L7/L12